MRRFHTAAVAGLAVSLASAAAYPQTAAIVGNVASDRQVPFDVVLPLRDKASLDALLVQQTDPTSGQYHKWLTPAEFASRFGPDPATMAVAAAALRSRGLAVTIGTRSLHASGNARQVGQALSTSLAMARTPSGTEEVVATGQITLPEVIRQAGGFVVDFGRTVYENHPFSREAADETDVDPANRSSTHGRYWYDDLKQAYQYPSYQSFISRNGQKTRLDGSGVTIGIVMDSDVYDSDIAMMFDHEHFTANSGQAWNPSLFKRVAVRGGSAINPNSLDEASLDTQQALGGAPGAHVVLYTVPSLSERNVTAANQAIIDANEADIVSMSFGQCALHFTAAYGGSDATVQYEHEQFEQGNAQGITFIASSGDDSGVTCPSANYAQDGTAGVFVPSTSHPADDPDVTAVGGTNLVTRHVEGSLDSQYVGENAYNDPFVPYDPDDKGATVSGGAWGAGGGIDALFARPLFQALTDTGSTSMRTLPDIGMQVGGCPAGPNTIKPCDGGDNPLNGNGNTERSSVAIIVAGRIHGEIGTSVSAPEFAGAAALLVERYGRMGNLNTWIYVYGLLQSLTGNKADSVLTAFHRAIPGYNQVVTNQRPGPDYNYTVGNGTPIVYRFVGSSDMQTAGLPQSPSNP